MFKHLALAAMLACTPTLALAQGLAPDAAVCNGSEMRHAEHTRAVGTALVAATAVGDLAAILTIPRNPSGAPIARDRFAILAATAPIGIAGFFVAQSASPGEKFWQRVITRLKVGQTRPADVQLCLHRPLVRTTGTTNERWTYLAARPTVFGGTLRMLTLTFRDSLLANVEWTEARKSDPGPAIHVASDRSGDRHHGFCMPPTTVSPDPFPTPMDTTYAAAAMARARADAEAAAKNAAAFAAYAACMASDTAP